VDSRNAAVRIKAPAVSAGATAVVVAAVRLVDRREAAAIRRRLVADSRAVDFRHLKCHSLGGADEALRPGNHNFAITS
jgi:hypothetical protein